MAMKSYNGGCHCGAVRFEADIDLAKGTTRCNCSICFKSRAWFTLVKADNLRMIVGDDAVADYQWTPPSRSEPNLHYHFCRTCGVRVFAQGDQEALGGRFYAVAVATLEDTDADELAASIKYVDGRHDHYDRQPEDIRLL
ncbi:MAG: Gfa-like protein [Caulobacter sp.]|nr:Gfa-like protein [Caulobacter sp.]